MKSFIAASKQFYDSVFAIREELEKVGHVVTPPNGFDDPHAEERAKRLSEEEYIQWKGKMIRGDSNIVAMHDAILILNFEKNGTVFFCTSNRSYRRRL